MKLSIADVFYQYRKGLPALNGVSMEFRPGELCFLAGNSGSGKTTLMHCVNGLIPHRRPRGTLSGVVSLYGRPLGDLSLFEISRDVGTVMQEPERQMVATHVMDEIAFGLENLAVSREHIGTKIAMVAKRLGIEHLLNREIATLSGGEKQKVAIAGILVLRPRAVLLDEPLASLDPASARDAMTHFRELANDGVTVIVSEHRRNYVLGANPDHCVLLDQGQVCFDGVPRNFPMEQRSSRPPSPLSNPDAPVLIQLEDVSFQYDHRTWGLRDVNLRIHTGDVIAVIGANGAGKSTLCRHLIGLHVPTKGRVLIGNHDTNEKEFTVAKIARHVGFVCQSPSAMLFDLTLRGEIGFGPTNMGFRADEIDEKVKAAAQIMGLSERLDHSPFDLSFGEQKRACVASVLAMGSRVLVLDEPTAGQDPCNVRRLIEHLMPSGGATDALIVATHDLDLARDYANRCVIVHNGTILADGETRRVLSDNDLLVKCRLN